MSKPASIYGGRLRLYSPACALLGALRCLAASQVAPPVHGVFYYTRYYTPTPTVSTSRLDRRPIRGGCAVPLIKPMANHHAFSRAPADYLCYRGWPGCFGCHARSSSSALRGLLVLPLPFGALAAWLDRMLMQTAAALTISCCRPGSPASGGQSRGLPRGRSPRAAGDPIAGRRRLGHQYGASGVVPDDAALRQ